MTRWTTIGAALALGTVACGGIGFDERTGGDAGRGDAAGLKIGPLVYDRVDAPRGDNTDWKKFELEESGKVTLKVWWDEPKAAKAVVELFDEGGDRIEILKHSAADREEQIGPLKLKKGVWFVRVLASEGASTYTLKIDLAGADDGGLSF